MGLFLLFPRGRSTDPPPRRRHGFLCAPLTAWQWAYAGLFRRSPAPAIERARRRDREACVILAAVSSIGRSGGHPRDFADPEGLEEKDVLASGVHKAGALPCGKDAAHGVRRAANHLGKILFPHLKRDR